MHQPSETPVLAREDILSRVRALRDLRHSDFGNEEETRRKQNVHGIDDEEIARQLSLLSSNTSGSAAVLTSYSLLHSLQHMDSMLGNTPLDYQLQELETPNGLFRMVLVVSPQVSLQDEHEVVTFVFGRLRASSPMGDSAAATWQSADAFGVERREPTLSKADKFQPLRSSRLEGQAEA
jgi:hypothetical protein